MLPPYPQYNFFKFLKRHIPSSGSGPIVDAPCGEGYISDRLAGAFPSRKVLGVDIDQQCIGNAHSHFHRENLAFQRQDIHSFLNAPVPMDDFLLVNSIFLLPEPKKVIEKIHRKLPVGGNLIVIMPNRESDNFINFQRLDPCQNTFTPGKETAVELFAGTGFRVEKVKGLCYTTIYGNRLLSQLGRLRGVYTYLGDYVNKFVGKKPSYWGFFLKKP